jgi:hypothetical protein
MLLLPPAPTGVSGVGTSEQECIPDPFSSKSRTSPTTVRITGPARVYAVTWEYTQTVQGATGTRQKRGRE